jgi:hypothetical protein
MGHVFLTNSQMRHLTSKVGFLRLEHREQSTSDTQVKTHLTIKLKIRLEILNVWTASVCL